MIVAGIDEAGRGCVIGPLVMCGVSIEDADLKMLEKIGVKDSKKLSPSRREDLYKKILEIVEKHVIIKITPQEIDSRTADSQNLNILEIDAMASIINKLKPDKVFIDAIQSNIHGFVMNLNHRLSHQCVIIAENRADDKFPVVSAASIVAKVTRDRIINELKTRYGDFGSGYPSDPKTKEWLKTFYKKRGGFPSIVRKSWFTVKQILNSSAQQSLDRYL